MNLLLKAKHWQLFIVFFVIPALVYVVMMGTMMNTMFADINSGGNPDPLYMFDSLKYYYALLILPMVVYYAWFWAVNVGLSSKVPQQAKTNLTRFKIFFFIPIVYFCFIFIFMAFFFQGFMENMMEQGEETVRYLGIGMTIITPLHLFSIFCVFYIIYFTAKTLKTIELKREVKFSDFVVEFLLIWILPVGVWFLQPKINEIVESEDDATDDIAPPPVHF